MYAVAFPCIDHIVDVAEALEAARDRREMDAVLAFRHRHHTMLGGFANDGEYSVEIGPHQIAFLFGDVCDCGVASFESGVIVARTLNDVRREEAPLHLMPLLKAEIIQKGKCVHGN